MVCLRVCVCVRFCEKWGVETSSVLTENIAHAARHNTRKCRENIHHLTFEARSKDTPRQGTAHRNVLFT